MTHTARTIRTALIASFIAALDTDADSLSDAVAELSTTDGFEMLADEIGALIRETRLTHDGETVTVRDIVDCGRGVAFSDLRGQPIILTSDGRCLTLNDGWSIDLSDETARAHVAAWLMRQEQAHLLMRDDASGEARHVFVQARDFESLTEREIDLLARLVLRLAGRS